MGACHGGDIYGQEILWDHSVNVNPLGTPEGVKEAVRQSALLCDRYPDSRCRGLVEKLARLHQLPGEAVLCGNGAADLIFQLVLGERPREGWLLAPTFSGYEEALAAVDARISYLELKKEAYFLPDVELLIRQLTEGIQPAADLPPADLAQAVQAAGLRQTAAERPFSRQLFLCNPNNPTGLALERQKLKRLAAFAEEKKIRLIVDECFLDFLEDPGCCTMVPELAHFPHMVILKAFTKLYGMAGLRLGYCLTMDSALYERMERIRQPWPVSLTAQMAGEAALEEKEYLARSRQAVREGREQLAKGLEALGFWVCPSQANYMLFMDLRPGAEDGRLGKGCREQKLLLRTCLDYHGLDGSYYRTCVKGKEENERLLAMLGGLYR